MIKIVDEYKQKKQTIDYINAFAEKGLYTAEDIAFYVQNAIGASQRFTLRYIEQGLERGILFIDAHKVISTAPIIAPQLIIENKSQVEVKRDVSKQEHNNKDKSERDKKNKSDSKKK